MKKLLGILEEIINIDSPTGYTKNIEEYLLKYLKKYLKKGKTSLTYTNKGNILFTIKGKDDKNHRLLTAHVDTLGAIVKSIKPNGRLMLDKMGGFSYNMVEGENCRVYLSNKNNKYLTGTILMHQTSVHVYKEVETLPRNQENIEVRLDILSKSKEDTLKYGVSVGDFVSFDPRFNVTEEGFIKSRFLDDKVSVAILLDLIEELEDLPYTTHIMFSVIEETGSGANSSIPKETKEYLAVDMGAIGDNQETDEYTVSICAKDASGAYNYDLRQHLVNLAKKNNVEFKVDLYPYYGSDASAALRAGADIKHGLIGSGIESSHSYERTHIKSIQNTKNLIKLYIFSKMC